MTKRLFQNNPYLSTCTATVTSIDQNKVTLDQSVFFAFSGGQESDAGTIGKIPVVQATDTSSKDSPGDIFYELEEPPTFEVGDQVEVVIDESRRRRIMRLHTAVHLAYYFVVQRLGELEIIGSNISEHKGRIDFSYDSSLSEVLADIQHDMELFISEDHEVLMQADKDKEHIRWWICEEWRMQCAGTHVSSTAEIGQVKLKRKNLGSGKERLEITFTKN